MGIKEIDSVISTPLDDRTTPLDDRTTSLDDRDFRVPERSRRDTEPNIGSLSGVEVPIT